MRTAILLLALLAGCDDAATEAINYARIAYPGAKCDKINTSTAVCRQGLDVYRCMVHDDVPYCDLVRQIDLERENPCAQPDVR